MKHAKALQSKSSLRVEDQRAGEKAAMIPLKLVLPIHSPIDSGKPPLFIKIANELVRLGVDVIPVTFGYYSKKLLEENFKRPERTSYDIVEFMRRTPTPTEEEMQLLEREYGSPNFMLIYYASYMRSYTEFCRLLVAHIKFWEYLMETERPTALFEEGVGGPELVLGAICKRYGVRLLNMQSARLTNRVVIKHNVYDDWEKTALIFRQLQRRSLTLEERQQAANFLSSFLASQDYPSYMKRRNEMTSPQFLLRTSLHRVRTLIRWATEKARSGYSSENPLVESVNMLAWLIRYLLYTKIVSFWDSPPHEDKYVLFPLHFEPEVTVGMYAPFFSDQLFVAGIISKSLPVDYRLYVREHPSMARRGFRPTSFYRQLRRIPQVRLISPAIPIHDLIRNAAAVVVLTSTTGLEAIFYGKPVIVLGNPFYKSSRLCYTVEDLNTLPLVVRKALEGKAADRETVLKFIVAILQGTYEGEIVWTLESSYSKNNVERLCGAILAEMKTSS
jgi:hypothetical protein